MDSTAYYDWVLGPVRTIRTHFGRLRLFAFPPKARFFLFPAGMCWMIPMIPRFAPGRCMVDRRGLRFVACPVLGGDVGLCHPGRLRSFETVGTADPRQPLAKATRWLNSRRGLMMSVLGPCLAARGSPPFRTGNHKSCLAGQGCRLATCDRHLYPRSVRYASLSFAGLLRGNLGAPIVTLLNAAWPLLDVYRICRAAVFGSFFLLRYLYDPKHLCLDRHAWSLGVAAGAFRLFSISAATPRCKWCLGSRWPHAAANVLFGVICCCSACAACIDLSLGRSRWPLPWPSSASIMRGGSNGNIWPGPPSSCTRWRHGFGPP